MAKRKSISMKNVVLAGGTIFLLLVIGIIALSGGFRFESVAQPVGYLVPDFGTAECRAGALKTFPSASGTWDIKVEEQKWQCGTLNLDANVNRCKYYFKYDAGLSLVNSGFEAKRCAKDGSCTDITRQPRQTAWAELATIEKGEYIKTIKYKPPLGAAFNTYSTGEAEMKAEAQVYQLVLKSADGFQRNIVEGCSIAAISKNSLLQSDVSKLEAGSIVPFDGVINWIERSIPVFDDANIVSGSIVGESGEIYITAPQKYYRVTDKTISGFKVVDSSVLLTSSAIECRPSETFCTSGAKLRETFDPSGKECSVLRGVASGYVPSGTNVDEICTLKCDNGFIKQDQCIAAPDCKSNEILDMRTGRCVDVGTSVGAEDGEECEEGSIRIGGECVPIWLLIAGLGLIIFIFLLIIAAFALKGRGAPTSATPVIIVGGK